MTPRHEDSLPWQNNYSTKSIMEIHKRKMHFFFTLIWSTQNQNVLIHYYTCSEYRHSIWKKRTLTFDSKPNRQMRKMRWQKSNKKSWTLTIWYWQNKMDNAKELIRQRQHEPYITVNVIYNSNLICTRGIKNQKYVI